MGRSHTLCMDKDNHLYVWGLGTNCIFQFHSSSGVDQLGIDPQSNPQSFVIESNEIAFIPTPTPFLFNKVSGYKDNMKLIAIACGNDFSVLLFDHSIDLMMEFDE